MTPLDRLREDPPATALFLDVDGTLSPIVPRPEDASVPEEVRAELRRLAGRYGLVACITGRPAETARAMVGLDEVRYAGEHGLELHPEAPAWVERKRDFVAGVEWPEEGKPLVASFHYRDHPDPEAARAELEQVAAAGEAAGFLVRWGRKVLEVVPPIEAHKGTAVRALLEESGLRRALYAGDDTTDLDGFRGLDGLDLAVRVAVSAPESPPELVEAADVVVEGTEGFLELLRSL